MSFKLLSRFERMAKDSNKYVVVVRRKRELDHAIKNGMDSERIEKCAERVRDAVLHYLKKNRPPFYYYAGTPRCAGWKAIERRWNDFSVAAVVDLVASWPAKPSARCIELR